VDDLQITDMEIRRPAVKKKKRKSFETRWVRLDRRWVKALQRSRSANTYRLALVILFEAFKREQVGGEIVLSTAMTGMSASSRGRAVRELVKLGLIKTDQYSRRAVRVTHIY
jgi:hypothetical protein